MSDKRGLPESRENECSTGYRRSGRGTPLREEGLRVLLREWQRLGKGDQELVEGALIGCRAWTIRPRSIRDSRWWRKRQKEA